MHLIDRVGDVNGQIDGLEPGCHAEITTFNGMRAAGLVHDSEDGFLILQTPDGRSRHAIRVEAVMGVQWCLEGCACEKMQYHEEGE